MGEEEGVADGGGCKEGGKDGGCVHNDGGGGGAVFRHSLQERGAGVDQGCDAAGVLLFNSIREKRLSDT